MDSQRSCGGAPEAGARSVAGADGVEARLRSQLPGDPVVALGAALGAGVAGAGADGVADGVAGAEPAGVSTMRSLFLGKGRTDDGWITGVQGVRETDRDVPTRN